MSEVNGTNPDEDAPAEQADSGGGADGTSAGATDPAPPPEKDAEALLAESRMECLKMREQWVRTAADFDNFRKRSRKEIDDARKAAREDLLKDLLPVFDNLERAMASAQRATEVKPVTDGLGMVLRQFADTTVRGMWYCTTLALRKLVRPVPAKAELWYDPSGISALQADAIDDANVMSQQISMIRQGMDGGFDPDVVVDAVTSGDLTKLKGNHSGMLSVQLRPPGSPDPAQGATPTPSPLAPATNGQGASQ